MADATMVFRNDPFLFIAGNVVNSIRGLNGNRFYNEVTEASSRKEVEIILIEKQEKRQRNTTKKTFDLTFHSQDPSIASIKAYWLPYMHGMDDVGFVDVEKENPRSKFIFTGAMNGCSLVVMQSNFNPNNLRVFHKQNPKKEQINNIVRRLSPDMRMVSEYTFEEYSRNNRINAFVFMHFFNNEWYYVAQNQAINNCDLSIDVNNVGNYSKTVFP